MLSPSQAPYRSKQSGTAQVKISSHLLALLAPPAEGPLLLTLLSIDTRLPAFLLLICLLGKVLTCSSGGRCRFGNGSLSCSLIFAFSKQSTALVHEMDLIGCCLRSPDSWLAFECSQRATGTRKGHKDARSFCVSDALLTAISINIMTPTLWTHKCTLKSFPLIISALILF